MKERLFGLTGNEGNHGEDVKECYFYLDSTPTHSYMKFLYKYPQVAFPYSQLVEENRRRGKLDAEFELLDTGVFAVSLCDVSARGCGICQAATRSVAARVVHASQREIACV